MVIKAALTAALMALLVVACHTCSTPPGQPESDLPQVFVWHLPEDFPAPRVPPDNPITPPKIELGRQLFHDKRLSGDGTVACASCHRPEKAYTDGRHRAVGIDGHTHPRAPMSPTNGV